MREHSTCASVKVAYSSARRTGLARVKRNVGSSYNAAASPAARLVTPAKIARGTNWIGRATRLRTSWITLFSEFAMRRTNARRFLKSAAILAAEHAAWSTIVESACAVARRSADMDPVAGDVARFASLVSRASDLSLVCGGTQLMVGERSCTWTCEHQRCTMPCSMISSRTPRGSAD